MVNIAEEKRKAEDFLKERAAKRQRPSTSPEAEGELIEIRRDDPEDEDNYTPPPAT